MKKWHGSLLICDDMSFTLTGKVDLRGVYTSDISISSAGIPISQLVAYVFVEGELSELPTTTVQVDVSVPGAQVSTVSFPPHVPPGLPGRTSWFLRTPLLIQNIRLQPGKIVGTVRHGDATLTLHGPWIVVTS